jgi:hypothetical protein
MTRRASSRITLKIFAWFQKVNGAYRSGAAALVTCDWLPTLLQIQVSGLGWMLWAQLGRETAFH